MKKVDLNKLKVLGDKEYWRQVGYKLRLSFRELPRVLFVKHSHVIDVISVSLVLVLAGYLVMSLFYFVPVGVETGAREQQQLSVDLLDRFGLWIDRRGQEKQRLLELSDDRLYEKLKIIE